MLQLLHKMAALSAIIIPEILKIPLRYTGPWQVMALGPGAGLMGAETQHPGMQIRIRRMIQTSYILHRRAFHCLLPGISK